MKTISFLIAMLYGTVCICQNLVPNPSFEDTLFCPIGLNDLDPIIGWSSYGNSVDCYNSCSATLNVPDSPFGFQYANSGESMIGLVTYVWQFSPSWPNYREYAGATLLEPLQVGQKYFVSFFINCAGYLPGWQIIGANKMGLKFSTVAYDQSSPPPLDNYAHLYTDSVITDTIQWFKVSGSFIADSAYTQVIIGNFYDSIQTDTIIFGGAPFGGSSAYYYVDDICVSTDSTYANSWTRVSEHSTLDDLALVFPNPFIDELSIHLFNNQLTTITIYNSLSRIILQQNIRNNTTIETIHFPAGAYYYILGTEKGEISTGKIVKY